MDRTLINCQDTTKFFKKSSTFEFDLKNNQKELKIL